MEFVTTGKVFNLKLFVLFFAISVCVVACTKINILEKNIAIKDHVWQSVVKPSVVFNIEDTVSLYNVYIVLRHFDAYNYNNIWIRCTVTNPGDTVARSRQYNLTLATNEEGWLGTGMDDIFENRILIQPGTKFNKTGEYKFVLEHIIACEDPLKSILNVGLRIEKMN